MYLDDEKLEIVVNNVLNNDDGFKFVCYLLSISHLNLQGAVFEPYKDYYNKGFRDFGLKIEEIVKKYAIEKYLTYIKNKNDESEG